MRCARLISCACLLLLVPTTVMSGWNERCKVAVHVLPHEYMRRCGDIPYIRDCEDITTTYEGCGEIDVFPVFYDVDYYVEVAYGLEWIGPQSCTFYSCSDITAGTITSSGDGIIQSWYDNKRGPVLIPGWAWMDVVEPDQICVTGYPPTRVITIRDWWDWLDSPVSNSCAGVCGWAGDEPCNPLAQALKITVDDGLTGDCILAGHYLTYTIAYENTSSDLWIESLVLEDDISPQTKYVSSTGGAYPSNGHVRWWIHDVGPGEGDSVELHVRVRANTPSDTYVVNACRADVNQEIVKQATESTLVCVDQFAPMELAKDDGTGGAGVRAGDTLTYAISYGNMGNAIDMHNVSLDDHLGWFLHFISASHGGSYRASTRSVTWDLGTVESGEQASVELVVQTDPYLSTDDVITNTCEIMSDEIRPVEIEAHTTVVRGWARLAAVHVTSCDGSHSCVSGLPEIVRCWDIRTETSVCGCVYVFPVFIDVGEYTGFSYSLIWPGEWGDMLFTSCSDMTVGNIVKPFDDIDQTWSSCRSGIYVIPGFGQLEASGPGRIKVYDGREGWAYSIDCQGNALGVDHHYWTGICGGVGSVLPCEGIPNQCTVPTTWGAIKAMFR